ncbi:MULTISPECIES: hypothetical protein [Burkholderia]|uniref:Lipopolysaccharide assembly protein B n=1 Tax=Burkholderia contaminans TaxID=488447 RepID=A0A6P2VHN8_9BURK|nr:MULTISPECIES: hypothetical protein [Burkholderia]NIE55675.1 hypothetical protein [Burkholderia sp. Ap-955]NIF11681.1 hypothetical protein [Burkholderia sp. Ax-1735]NIG05128.1 hypothetical protein [Burkholderia sp. Tr-849]OXJ31980.1 hypothetical protein CFB82_21230 [Burkholderia sp. HI2714]VWC81149.1 hypothetical protein BCO71033_00464 [Burkholderia contaminans]
MRVLLNRTTRARDDWRAILNARAEARRTASFRCRECGFVAFRALEHCPVCGRRNWPFDSIHHASDDAHATHAPHAFHTWSSRIARALRNAAFQQPRASTAPILSILTLVLLVGGYVVVDRTCKADPVCRGSNGSRAMASDAPRYASNDPVLPVLPAPVYPFHSTDGTQVAAARPGSPSPDTTRASAGPTAVARAAPAMRAPDRSHPAATVRLTGWKGSHGAAHRPHTFHRVSTHTARARRSTAGNTQQIAQLYRGH